MATLITQKWQFFLNKNDNFFTQKWPFDLHKNDNSFYTKMTIRSIQKGHFLLTKKDNFYTKITFFTHKYDYYFYSKTIV